MPTTAKLVIATPTHSKLTFMDSSKKLFSAVCLCVCKGTVNAVVKARECDVFNGVCEAEEDDSRLEITNSSLIFANTVERGKVNDSRELKLDKYVFCVPFGNVEMLAAEDCLLAGVALVAPGRTESIVVVPVENDSVVVIIGTVVGFGTVFTNVTKKCILELYSSGAVDMTFSLQVKTSW